MSESIDNHILSPSESFNGSDDEKGEQRRKSRNLSEKKRRDQFNVLISELWSIVSSSGRKMDKSNVLKATLTFLSAHKELSGTATVEDTHGDWKPMFLSNEEFAHLLLEALDGFVLVISQRGTILYVSESIVSFLGYLPKELLNRSIFDFMSSNSAEVFGTTIAQSTQAFKKDISVITHFRLGQFRQTTGRDYQLVRFDGFLRKHSTSGMSLASSTASQDNILIATGRLLDMKLLREITIHVPKMEFSSRHSLEWKFIYLDHHAPSIIGYLPFEVLGTSGYDYYHEEDLEKMSNCHSFLMQKGEGTSCHYRFLTKGQQWIWLQTRFFITYHQWNSKPQFIVCTHRVISFQDAFALSKSEQLFRAGIENAGHKMSRSGTSFLPRKSHGLTRQQSSIFGSPHQSNATGTWSSNNFGNTCRRGTKRRSTTTTATATTEADVKRAFLTDSATDGLATGDSFGNTTVTRVASAVGVSNVNYGSLATGSSTSLTPGQLLRRNAELQRRLLHQQEELRQVRQLLTQHHPIVPSQHEHDNDKAPQ